MTRTMTTRLFTRAAALLLALALTACNGNSSNDTAASAAASPAASAAASPAATTATVTDPLLFSATSYSVAQTQGSVTLTVLRVGDASAAVTVEYSTADDTAIAGTDYSAAAGTLEWAENDSTAKTIVVSLMSTAPYIGSKAFSVMLSNPGSTAQIATPDATVVTIYGTGVASIGSPQLSSSQYAVAQITNQLLITVNRVAGSSGPLSVNYTTSDGSAVNGIDYTAVGGTLEWADGDATSKGFVVSVSDAQPFVGTKSFGVALSSPSSGAVLGNPDAATVTISGSGSASAGTLRLTATSYTVKQSAGTLQVSVDRTGGISGSVSVAYATTGGTAVAGTDFTATSGTLTWAAGDTAPKAFAVPISNAAPFAGNKVFSISLAAPANGATISSPGSASVTIAGDAAPAVGSLQLSASTYAVAQSAGALTVGVSRVGGSSGSVSVNYAAKSGTAVAGTDFTTTTGSLQWSDGDSATKAFSIPISSAKPFSGTKSLRIALSNPTGGSVLGSPSSATASITGAASAAVGSVQLAASTYTVTQTAGTLNVTVNRTGGSTGAVSVAYKTSGASAQVGIDYVSTVGTLDWSDGDSASKALWIPILDTGSTSNRTFNFTLSNPAGGATIGNPGSAIITISGATPSGGSGGGTTGGTGDPSAPSGLRVTRQGSSSISLSWSAATAGANPIASYKIYRNGSSYGTSTSTSYTDNAAWNATNVNYNAAATIYSYTVSAVDSEGREGPQTSQTTFNVYTDGVYSWAGDYSYSASANYWDSSGGPESGPYDIQVTVNSAYGGFQPYAGNVVPQWDLEVGSFGYLSIDLKPTIGGQAWQLSVISRLPPGDVYPWAVVNIGDYGPAPVAGKWATYKIPLSALSIGKTYFQGSISGNTLTVTSVNGGVGVDAGGFISGDGVSPGTYIVGHSANGGPGTYRISPAQSVSSTSMTEQRTAVYKLDIADQSGANWNQFYIDNMKFLAQ